MMLQLFLIDVAGKVGFGKTGKKQLEDPGLRPKSI